MPVRQRFRVLFRDPGVSGRPAARPSPFPPLCAAERAVVPCFRACWGAPAAPTGLFTEIGQNGKSSPHRLRRIGILFTPPNPGSAAEPF